MRLKNILIIVDKLEESVRFYKDLFGLQVILKQEGNVILSEGLVLQDVNVWYESTQIPTTSHSNMTELYFEENDMECFIKKLESYDFCLNYIYRCRCMSGSGHCRSDCGKI